MLACKFDSPDSLIEEDVTVILGLEASGSLENRTSLPGDDASISALYSFEMLGLIFCINGMVDDNSSRGVPSSAFGNQPYLKEG